MTNAKIIVKVGKKSKLKFSHSKVYRAINIDSLFTLSNQVSDCHIVVIENISKDEEEDTKRFIQSFVEKDSKNLVLFYIPEDDDITSGLADELEYNIFMSLDTLYKEIYNKCGVSVSIFLRDKQKLNKENEYAIDGMSDIFGDINEEFNDDLQKTIDDTDTTSVSLEKIEEDCEDKIEENSEKSLEDTDTTNITDENALLKIANLKMELNDYKYDYSVIQKDMVEAINRTEKLEKIVEILTDEKETLQQTFNDIVLSDIVMEDPISLAEFEGIKEELVNAHSKVKELESNIDSLKETINLNNETIASNESTIKETQEKLSNLTKFIDSGEVHKEIIEEHKIQLQEITEEKDRLNIELVNAQGKYDNILASIASTEEELRLYSNYRQHTIELFKLAFDKVKEKNNIISELNVNISELDTKLNSINEQLSNANKVIEDKQAIIDESNKEIERLKEEISGISAEKDKISEEKDILEKRSEVSNNYSEQEIEKLNSKISQLETKLKVTTEQLNAKEAQYNDMLTRTALESSSTQSLVDTNRSLEQINKSFREKLSLISREAEEAKRDRDKLKVQLEASKTQCKNLNDAVQALSGASGANVAALVNNTVKPIAYNGRAQIIPVFGSGSFGITTTAMSLAYKLCMTSKVLYIDLDLVSPRADSWFNKMPMISGIPGVAGNGLNDTGMGIIINKGISAVSPYLDNLIIKNCETTKGGGIDYLGGCYKRIEQSKLVETDFTTLLSMLSNLYNYIIIDMGKIGTNEAADSLIKAMSDISFRTVVVTTSDKLEVRDFRNKLSENRIDPNKLAWLLNMCESTTIDDKTKQYINPTKFGIMLNDTTMRGTRTMFMKNKVNKDKLDLFINTTLFGGK